ncbi:MAG: cellulase family glycosylhydrolase [Saccharospirillaceae bacterium]|nr:cellulase family glycosylhydrolase [Pseudomonadales bacterium]NRB80147.1 cellulase family glycosylhydrolase [Saccharospirillaceae bacterium]
MIKHLASASCLTLLLAGCDVASSEDTSGNPIASFTAQSTQDSQNSVVLIDGQYTGTAPLTMKFDSSTSTDNNQISSVAWKVDGEDAGSASILDYDFTEVGTYIVQLTVTDNEGLESIKTTYINVEAQNQAPVVSAGSDVNVSVGEDIILSGFATDEDGDLLTTNWSVNNNIYPGNTVKTVINEAGLYEAIYTVTDQTVIRTDSLWVTVTALNIENNAPVLTVGSNINVDENVSFILIGSAIDGDGDLLTATWTINNQTQPGNTVSVSGITTAGIYDAVYSVSDGTVTKTKTLYVTVSAVDDLNPAPVVDAGNNVIALAGRDFILSGFATDANSDLLTYSWTVNNQTYPGAAVNASIATAGSYIAVLSVSDGNSTRTDSVTVTINADVVITDDEYYVAGLSTMPAQYSLSTIENCGVNTVVPNDEFLVIGDVVLGTAEGWSHIASTSGDWNGLTKQKSDYDIDKNGYNATDSACNNIKTYNAVLVKKLHDWDQAHSNGFKYLIDSSNPSFAEMDTITLDIYYDANDSSIPNKTQITSAYSSHLSSSQITALDGNGEFQLDIQLDVDLPNPTSPPTEYYDTEGDVHGTLNLNFTAAQANKWLRLEIPVNSLIFREETANWGVKVVSYNSIKNLQPNKISFVAESKSRETARHALPDNIKNNQSAFDNLNLTKLFKEESFRIKQLSISKAGSGSNTAPTVSIGANQTVDEGDIVSIISTVNDVDADFLNYQWKIDNSNYSTTNNFNKTFTQAGSYVVSLSVNDGTVTTTKSVTITVDDAGDTCATSGTPVQMYGDLYTDGNKLRGCGGQEVQLRGMSMFWSQWSSQFYNRGVVDTLVDDWNVNVLRAAMGVDAGDGYLTGSAGKTAELLNVETMIEAAIARGVYILIDWHTHHGESIGLEITVGATTKIINVKQGAIEFFEDIATRYGQHPNIIYEIYNEPLYVSWDSDLRPYALEVIAAIRAIDPDNLIIMGTESWSQEVDDAGRNPITSYPNIAYTVHFYACTHKASYRSKVQSAINNDVVVFATEWGMSQANGGTYGTYPDTTNDNTICISETEKWLELFDDNNISWLNWSLMDKDESSSALIPGASITGDWINNDLSPSGQWLKDRLNDARYD